ncbi:metallophosphoesterase domain-containing protein [Rhizobium etli 8C-3]|uniref:Metallophosphoesterase domain-containing protein n=2 Tax=Rhizobium TaxID=379 RepID=A0A1L5P0I3_RHIET|nr:MULTISPECIES: metallophosphoesterase [Rhizobium]APO73664.1 metallophosphoesterase domain-containing protein [Rhizobium etli 8C-3]TCU27992.1 alkaline phosphatase D [Rhizobium azibense]
MKIIQITDTHFSPEKTHFNGNWAPLLSWIEDQEADLIVHTGDLTVDGADKADDISFSMDLMRQVSTPMLIVPGNHDVGHFSHMSQPVNTERLARWRSLAGGDRFVEDANGWRLVGLNALLFGREDEEEEAQFEWLRTAFEERDGRRLALFAHKPLFVDEPHEGDTGYWGLRPKQRQRVYDLMAAHDVALYASGHLHWAWKGRFENTSVVWGPSAAFVIDTLEREMPGERLIGAVLHHLGDEVRSEIVAVPGMTAHVIDDVIHEVYPASAPKARAAQEEAE